MKTATLLANWLPFHRNPLIVPNDYTGTPMKIRHVIIGLFMTSLVGVFTATPPTVTQAQIPCNATAIYDASTSGATQLVAGTATQQIFICGFNIFSGGTVNVDLVYGTGSTCGTGTIKITPAYEFTAQTGIVDHVAIFNGLTAVPESNNLCINTSGGV